MTDEVERAERILAGLCPDCGKPLPDHTIICASEHQNRMQRLKNAAVKTALRNTLDTIRENRDV